MKKIFALALASVIIFSLSACGQKITQAELRLERLGSTISKTIKQGWNL